MNFEELSDQLRVKKFHPSTIIEGGKEVGLEVYAPPLHHYYHLETIKKIIGDEYRADYLPNSDFILIKKL